MLSSFRRLSKSKLGTIVMAVVLLGILAGFAISDARNFGSGALGLGLGGDTLVKVGNQSVGERDMSEMLQQQLQAARQENPQATYATIMGDYDAMLDSLVDQRALIGFAEKTGFYVPKALVDAEIAQLPGTRGLNGKFSDTAYQQFLTQRKLTDGQVRDLIKGGILQRLLLAPVAVSARVPSALATPYASMLLEQREGEVIALPIEAFAAGLKPTDAQVQQFYTKNRAQYVVPEQRVLRIAVIGPAAVEGVTVSDKEISDYYNANSATYGGGSTRSLTQAVVPDQKSAAAIAAKVKAGSTFAAAAAPFGDNASVTTLKDQKSADYASAAGQKVASAVFAAPAGTVIGPLQSDFGWVVVKVDSAQAGGGKSLAQARSEIAAKLTSDKRKAALEDLVAKAQNSLDDGANFTETANALKLSSTETPLILSSGVNRANASQRVAQDLMPAVKSGFELGNGDEPDIVSLGEGKGYAMVSPSSIVPAAPLPLASIKQQVAADWLIGEAAKRAKAAADKMIAGASAGKSLNDSAKSLGIPLPPSHPLAARRMQIADAQGQVAPPLRVLFSLPQGKAGVIPDPQGRGLYVVRVAKVIPGNAVLQPDLIARMQTDMRDSLTEDYAREFVAAIRNDLGVKRNDAEIAAMRKRMLETAN